jgi:cardiolipin synthase
MGRSRHASHAIARRGGITSLAARLAAASVLGFPASPRRQEEAPNVTEGLWPVLTLITLVTLQGATIMRVFLRPYREPTSRITWMVVILALPAVGIIGYVLFGEVNIGRKRIERMRRAIAELPDLGPVFAAAGPAAEPRYPEEYGHLFRTGRSINGFEPVGGNRATLLPGPHETIDAMVADIDAAREHVHVCFYIWLPDGSGLKVADALIRAAGRGVACRAIADDLGSRLLIGSEHWQRMERAGIALERALPIGNPLLRILRGRVDLRNHRKIVVIDNRITYCGSQNCADPEFRVKPKFAPWVDAVMRFEGPVARQNQALFVADWMAEIDEDIHEILTEPIGEVEEGFTAQVIGTGPTVRYSAMPEMFESLMFRARRELVITTPYYVPTESLQSAITAAAHRGVETTLVLPARNDSWIVGAASRSCYAALLEAGVRIFEYEGGLLHTKSLTMDGQITLIGSANLDRRSFELNYENNILLYDVDLTAEMMKRQRAYIASSREVMAEEVNAWGWPRRLANNAVAMLGPIL